MVNRLHGKITKTNNQLRLAKLVFGTVLREKINFIPKNKMSKCEIITINYYLTGRLREDN